MNHVRRTQRGSALLVTLVFLAFLLLVTTTVITYGRNTRSFATRISRRQTRMSCAEAGLQVAKAYFLANQSQWNTFLSNPQVYNPVAAQWIINTGLAPADPYTAGSGSNPLHTHPELFADLDGDGQADVYIYVRDNQDELPPAADNWERDNDGTVIVGAMCISQTLNPRLMNNQTDTNPLIVEATLTSNASAKSNYKMGFGCGNGDGNLNNCS